MRLEHQVVQNTLQMGQWTETFQQQCFLKISLGHEDYQIIAQHYKRNYLQYQKQLNIRTITVMERLLYTQTPCQLC